MTTSTTTAMESCKGTELVLKHIVKYPKTITKNRKTIILLHGLGGNENDLFAFTNQFPEEYLIISVRAPFKQSTNSYAWFEVQLYKYRREINFEQAEKSRLIIKQFINQIVERYNADSSNITILGFSQGAVMAYSVGLTAPEKVKNIAVFGGRILDEIKPLQSTNLESIKHLNILISHGSYDEMMPFNYALQAYKYLNSLECEIELKIYPTTHTISSNQIADFNLWLKQ